VSASRKRVIRVAVIDSGWRMALWHRRVRRGRAFFVAGEPYRPAYSSDVNDLIGHGTACARLILAVAATAEVVPLRVFHKSLDTSPEVLCSALHWARQQGFDIGNLSLSTAREDARDTLYAACARLHAAGSFIVAAASNDGNTSYPAAFDGVAGAALTHLKRSECKTEYESMDFVIQRGWTPPLARARSINSTSEAAAFLSGCAALLCASDGSVTVETLRAALLSDYPGALSL
jgi:subtilisin